MAKSRKRSTPLTARELRFAALLVTMRKARGLSQVAVAKRSGLAVDTIGRLAARGVIHRVASRRNFRRGRGAKPQLYRAYCKVWRQSPRRKGQARRREGLRHGLLERGTLSPSLETLLKLADGLRVSLSTVLLAFEKLERDGVVELAEVARSLEPQELAVGLRVLIVLAELLRGAEWDAE